MSVSLQFLEVGSCQHPDRMVLPKTGSLLKNRRFPSSVALIRHPTEGVILFDTGYSTHFHEVTRKFPNRLYALVTPVDLSEGETAQAQLQRLGIRPEEVKWIIISHFHGDHIAGLRDFPKARFIHDREAWDRLQGLSAFASLRAAYLPGLVPEDFQSRNRPIESGEYVAYADPLPGFPRGVDLFGDGCLIGIPLPGHAHGHLGLLVRGESGEEHFLIADAAWTRDSVVLNQPPVPLAALIMSDFQEYRSTLRRLHELTKLRPSTRIVACHCSETHAELRTEFQKRSLKAGERVR